MAVTWLQAKTKLRRAILKDVAAKKWDDDVLLDFANMAIDDLSGWQPIAKSLTLTGTGVLYVFDLPTDLRTIDAILWYDGQPLQELTDKRLRKGQMFYLPETITGDTDLAYLEHWPEEGKLTLTRILPSARTARLYYGAYRPHLTGDTANLPIGANAWMEAAFYYYIAMLANLRDGVPAALLEFFKSRTDMNVGSPYNLEAAEWYMQYRRLITENAPK